MNALNAASHPTPTDLRDRAIIVTGAARGLGLAIAHSLAARGARLALIDRDGEALKQVAATLRERTSASVHTVVADLSSFEQATLSARDAITWAGTIDGLVNNAGITRDGLLAKLSEADWDAVLAVNLKSVFGIGQVAAQHWIERAKNGEPVDAAIVNIASVAYQGNVGQSNYSAAKAGVVALSATWALELARFGVRSNAIAPGFIETEMTNAIPAAIRARVLERVPLRRMGSPTDIAEACAFLLGPSARYITGHTLVVDGGLSTGAGL